MMTEKKRMTVIAEQLGLAREQLDKRVDAGDLGADLRVLRAAYHHADYAGWHLDEIHGEGPMVAVLRAMCTAIMSEIDMRYSVAVGLDS